jgi:hypothetical protein
MVRKKRKPKKLSFRKNKADNPGLAPNSHSLNIDNALNTALHHHRNGQINKAEKFYKKILKVDPNHADALHFLRLIGRGAPKGSRSAKTLAIYRNQKVYDF